MHSNWNFFKVKLVKGGAEDNYMLEAHERLYPKYLPYATKQILTNTDSSIVSVSSKLKRVRH